MTKKHVTVNFINMFSKKNKKSQGFPEEKEKYIDELHCCP